MSGNKYKDILDGFEESEKWKLLFVLEYLDQFHPKIEIDREFQRKLKSRLLHSQRSQWMNWYRKLSYLSVFATSFILLFGIWKIWWIPTHLSQEWWNYSLSVPFSPSSIEDKIEWIHDDTSWTWEQKNNTLPIADTASSLAESDDPPIVTNSMKGVSSPGNREKSNQLTKTAPIVSEDTISLSDEINSISDEINNFTPTSKQQSWDPELALATTKMFTEPSVMEMNDSTLVLPIDYPNKMAVYKKWTPWSQAEIDSRTGSGMVKKLEPTLTKDKMREILIKNWNITNVTLEYRKARKNSEEQYSIVPSVRTLNANGEPLYISLISGYTLD
jgi:hypothetical protein